MPLPKRRHSSTRGRKRRTHYKLDGAHAVDLPPVPRAQGSPPRLPPLRVLQGARSRLDRRRLGAAPDAPGAAG